MLTITAGIATASFYRYELFSIFPKSWRWQIVNQTQDKFLANITIIIKRENKILLTKHTYQTLWTLPGGWINHDETLQEAARREIDEELGFSLEKIEIINYELDKQRPVFNILAIATFNNTEYPKKSHPEIEQFDFFKINNLPDMMPLHRAYIEKYR